jgi:hypothetical protein
VRCASGKSPQRRSGFGQRYTSMPSFLTVDAIVVIDRSLAIDVVSNLPE